jgi:hypothetical protein
MQSGWIELSADEWRLYFKLSRLIRCVTSPVFPLVIAAFLVSSLRFSGSCVPINAVAPVISAAAFLFYVRVREDPPIIILSNGFASLFAFAYVDAMVGLAVAAAAIWIGQTLVRRIDGQHNAFSSRLAAMAACRGASLAAVRSARQRPRSLRPSKMARP